MASHCVTYIRAGKGIMQHKNRLRLFLFLALVLTVLTIAPLAYASDQVVNNCANDAELRADLTTMQSTNGGTLTFNCQTTINITSQLPAITTNTTIDGGNNVVLTGLSSVRLFEVDNNGFLQLKNIVLERGYGGSGDGGTIYSVGRLDLDRVTIRNSYSPFKGGAIYTTGRLDVAFSTLQDNTGGGGGGAIYASGQNSELNISSSNFINNEATTPNPGGAIYASHTLNVLNSKFSLNKGGRGGAIYTRRTVAVGTTTIQGSEFFENKTTGMYPNANGAALLVENIRAIVTLTTMYDNNGQSGGAIYITSDGQLELTYSTLRDNTSTNGGGIYNKGTASLESVTLARNGLGSGHGGGIDNFGTLTLENVTLSGNSATYGAGIKNEGGSATLTNVTLSNNQEVNINGGAIFNTGGSTQLHMKNVLVANTTSGPNCKFGQPLMSNETNLSDDMSCNFGAGRDNLDDKLDPLGNNGGSTQTHLPRPDSAAIDYGNAVTGMTVDQRGKPRPQGKLFDVGAVEGCSKPAKPTLVKPADNAPVGKVVVKLKWNAADCAAKYIVIVKNKATGKTAAKFTGTALKFKTNPPLTRGVTYEWFAKGCNPPRGCNKSAKWEFTVQ
jgi:hypothetical protein